MNPPNDDRALHRKHYYLTEKVPDVNTGYKYPGCTQAELRELDHAHENAHRSRGKIQANVRSLDDGQTQSLAEAASITRFAKMPSIGSGLRGTIRVGHPRSR